VLFYSAKRAFKPLLGVKPVLGPAVTYKSSFAAKYYIARLFVYSIERRLYRRPASGAAEKQQISVLMNKVKIKIIAGFILALGLTGVVAILMTHNLKELRSVADAVSRPDIRSQKVQFLIADISQAESGIRAYSLSKEEKYLTPYYHFLSSFEGKLDSVRVLSAGNKSQEKENSTLDSLVSEKLNLFFEFLDLKKNETIKTALEDIAKKMQEPDARNTQPPPSARFFDKIRALFGEKESLLYTDSIHLKTKAEKLQKLVVAAQKMNEKQTAIMSKKELELLNRDDSVMAGIRSLSKQIQREEHKKEVVKVLLVKHQVEAAMRKILITGVVGMLLLLVLIYLIFSDISDSNRYRKELEQAKIKAEELARAKQEFLANMSHEIRTPLNAIIGFTKLLYKSKQGPAELTYLESVRQSSEHLLNVVNDILDFSKAEAGHLRIDPTAFRIGAIVKEAVEVMKNSAAQKKIDLVSNVDPVFDKMVLICDSFRIKQVLLNLISNAIKFTDKGKVEIRCSPREAGSGSVILEIQVIDTGVGIPENRIAYIFKEFSQAGTDTARKYGGTGLGLTICKKLSELMNGSISAASALNIGSTFTFSVPCRIGAEKDLLPPEEEGVLSVDTSILAKKTVLIADDDELNRLLLTTVLKGFGMLSDEACDGREALNKVTSGNYDILLTDIQMPELSGLELVKEIRKLSDDIRSKIPVIALTANIEKEDIQKYLDAGMNDCLLKPYKEEILFNKIAHALHLTERKGEA
jgi:signal transduction histidine kinase/ActR/RegA family two-component response regulator